MNNKPLTKRIGKIAFIINSRLSSFKKKSTWYKLKSCINTISATEALLETYLDEVSVHVSMTPGKSLLFIYSALQALFVQQNAVENLCSSLNITYLIHADIEEIRNIRNDIVGHPTDRRDSGYGHEFNVILGISPFADNIQVGTDYPEFPTNNPKTQSISRFMPVDVPDLITKQIQRFIQVLDNILETLQKDSEEIKGDIEHLQKISRGMLFPPKGNE